MRIRQNENSYLLHLKAKQGEIDSGLGFLSSIEREREREREREPILSRFSTVQTVGS